MAHRRMRDAEFRKSQVDGTYAEHVAPINKLVDRLRNAEGRGWMPYVAPIYGGIEARVLLLLSDPARKTNNETGFDGSGFLCLENAIYVYVVSPSKGDMRLFIGLCMARRSTAWTPRRRTGRSSRKEACRHPSGTSLTKSVSVVLRCEFTKGCTIGQSSREYHGAR